MPHFDEYAPICWDHFFIYSESAPLEKKEDGAYSDRFMPVIFHEWFLGT